MEIIIVRRRRHPSKMSCFSKREVASEDHPVSADEEAELRIVLLGKVGVGKSASGNSILGEENLFPSKRGLSAVTVKCQKETRIVGTRSVVVVDTPGLFQVDRTDEEVVREIKRSVSLAKPGPHVFLVVLKVTDKYTDEEKQMMEIIRSSFGKHTMAFTMVLFTYGGALQETSIHDFVRSNGNLHHLVKQCNWGCHVFDNKAERSDQVSELLLKIRDRVQASGRVHYTAEMLQEAEVNQQVQDAPGGAAAGGRSAIQTTTFSGMAVGCLMGYLVSGGEVTSTLGAALGGAAGGILGISVALLVILAKSRIKKCSVV